MTHHRTTWPRRPGALLRPNGRTATVRALVAKHVAATATVPTAAEIARTLAMSQMRVERHLRFIASQVENTTWRQCGSTELSQTGPAS